MVNTETNKVLLLKSSYMKILKKYDGKKNLINKLHTSIKAIGNSYFVKNSLFTHTVYETAFERITLSEVSKINYTYFIYTNLITKIRRRIDFNEYNDKTDERRARLLRVKRKKDLLLKLEDFYELQSKLFRDVPELTLESYVEQVMQTTLSPISVEYFSIKPFPNVKWKKGEEVVQITRTYQGIEIQLMFGGQMVVSPDYYCEE